MSREAWKLVSNDYRGLNITLYLMYHRHFCKKRFDEFNFHQNIDNNINYFPHYLPGNIIIAPKKSIGLFCFDSFDAAYRYKTRMPLRTQHNFRIIRVIGYYPRKNKHMIPLAPTNPFSVIDWNKKRKNTIMDCKIPSDTLLFDKIHIDKEV